MAYRKRLLDQPQTDIPLEPLRGGQLMKRDRASSVHATGDRVLRHGRRILATIGLNNADSWHVSDAAVSEETTTHPLPNVERVVMRVPAQPLTPGHFVRVCIVANPSGKTQTAGYQDAGAKGAVKVTATYNNGGSVSVSKTLGLAGSLEPNGAQPQGAGAAWNKVIKVESEPLFPADMKSISNLAAWSDGVTVELTIAYIGAPRVIDCVVYEQPYAIAYDIAAGDWIAPLHANGTGTNLGQLPDNVPLIKHSADDRRAGAEVVADSARRQSQELGPVLFTASTWNEGAGDFTSTEAAARSITSTGWTEMYTGSTAAYDAAEPGWSLASGANARRVQESEHTVVMRDSDNVVPVRCYVYARMTTAGPSAKVRVESANYSVAEIAVSAGTSWAWHYASGHLRCGLGAQDTDSVVQARGQVSSLGATMQWRYLVVVFADL